VSPFAAASWVRAVTVRRKNPAAKKLSAKREALFPPGKPSLFGADLALHPPTDRCDRAKIPAMVLLFPRP
jgi:hypothetical protein